ncbi:MAG: DUF2804 domain-containing protein [Clostridiales bacterium]|nr:DUF2804 domain-containing protein [Clostridiales bacterium]
MNTEITTTEQLLDSKGNLQRCGYARHFNFILDKKQAKLPSLKLKEWDFYQVHFDERYVLQLTVGHVSYAMQISATLLDLTTGQKREVGLIKPCTRAFRNAMPTNPEVANKISYEGKNLHVLLETTDKYRILCLTATDFYGIKAEIRLMFTNVSKAKDKMVIATPFAKKRRWYLNYKENCFVVNGNARIEDVSYDIKNGFGLIDWGRGVWPYRHSWVWGNGGTKVNGKHFGFNIGWGFGNTEAATENMFFYDNKAYKLGEVREIAVGDNFRYVDDSGRFEFDVETIFDNHTKTKLLWVNNECHQRFGVWRGRVKLDDGKVLEIPPFTAFCEHARNRW